MRNGIAKLKKWIVALVVVVLAGSFAACNAGVEVVDRGDDDNWYFDLHIKIDSTLVTVLEASATKNLLQESNRNWTVKDWLLTYFGVLADSRELTAEYNGAAQLNGLHYYRFLLTVPKNGNMKDKIGVESTSKVSTNLFIRTINAERQDRFNYWQQAFYAVYPRYESHTPLQSDYFDEMGMILFGARVYTGDNETQGDGYLYDETYGQYYRELLPAFGAAFTVADVYMRNHSDFSLKTNWFASRNMLTSADKKIVGDGGAYYVFEKTLGGGPSVIFYRYFRADPTGWYLLALVLGGLSVAAVLLFARQAKKKPPAKPQPKDLFPYDPFDGQY